MKEIGRYVKRRDRERKKKTIYEGGGEMEMKEGTTKKVKVGFDWACYNVIGP